MANINYANKEIIIKIVYYGPGMSGKTTNLQVIHQMVPQNAASKMISLATEQDRTLFFDLLPLSLGSVKGFNTKFQLYTVPGQVYYNTTRKLVLNGVDGVVFVADSQKDKMDENKESINNLKENLSEYGIDMNNFAVVMQYNKRDMDNLSSIEELQKELNPYGFPYTEAVAVKGTGLMETLKLISKITLARIGQKSPSSSTPAPQPQANEGAQGGQDAQKSSEFFKNLMNKMNK
ncbi:GTPase-like protein [Chloroherpeton thalassium ATCC 35110]|uniref:GTPase-like protein n=1 Tax=Chloroherpeton thalassium (strain ATCC 35110 / GB-78) TaxID=517418 RepID=B3QWQ0_CHLT3|nr:GTPase domain-containing protein [Chloroherpeton thalassium]ACF14810.1 GTPase-like protein [Chloroherpeton thalassium ATCC 35110]